MGVVDKTVDTAGGAVVGGAKGALTGFLLSVAVGALVVGGIAMGGIALAGAAAGALGMAGASASAAAFSGAGLAAAGIAALGGGVAGGVGGAGPATLGGAIGALVGGGKKLFSGKAEPEPQIDQLLAAERERSKALTAQLVERQQAASGFDNEVKGNMAPKVQAQQAAAQQQGASVG